MASREYIVNILKALDDIKRDDLEELTKICRTAIMVYTVDGVPQTLPQQHIDALIQQFKAKRDNLVAKLKAI